MSRRSVQVLGAGPAGLSAAIGLQRSGLHVDVYEKRLRWTGRVCGCFLSPEAVRHLQWLNVFDSVKNDAVVIRGTTITWGHRSAVVPMQKDQYGLALSRQRLEDILAKRALSEGVQIHAGFPDETSGAALRVMAGGRYSVARPRPQHRWYGWNAVFHNVNQQPGEMSMHFYPGGYVGVVTFADRTTNVCGLSLDRPEDGGWETSFERARERSRPFAIEMSGATRSSDWLGVGPMPFESALAELDNGVAVGDAAAVGDPFMGEGNSRALAAGPMLHDGLLARQDFRSFYRSRWNSAYASRLKMGQRLRWVLERPWLASRLMPFLLQRPSFLRRLSPLFHSGYFW